MMLEPAIAHARDRAARGAVFLQGAGRFRASASDALSWAISTSASGGGAGERASGGSRCVYSWKALALHGLRSPV